MIETLPDDIRAFAPEWGLVLGSGLGPLVEQLRIVSEIPFSEVKGLPAAHVPGHAGRLLCATIGGRRMLIAQGRAHLYEGHSAREVGAMMRLMDALTIKRVVLTNAAGSLHDDWPLGRWMMVTDHLNLTGTSPLLGGPNFFDMTEVYSRALRARLCAAAGSIGLPLLKGIYAAMVGPQYETPAEVRMVRALGGDAVGMSTVHEAIQARALGMEVVAFSCLTNYGAGIIDHPLDHRDVLETGRAAASEFLALLEAALPDA